MNSADLAQTIPASPEDLAERLHALHAFGHDSVISNLLANLHGLADAAFDTPGIDQEQARLIAQSLTRAAEIISGAAADFIDRARADTGAEWQS